MNVRLVVVQGRPEGMEVPVASDPFLIGRDTTCHLRATQEAISKRHCVILCKADGVWVHDLNSTNGTFLNHDRIRGEVRARDGDLLQVGPLVFAFKIEAVKGAAAGPKQSGSPDAQALVWLAEPADVESGDRSANQDTALMQLAANAPGKQAPERPAAAPTPAPAPAAKEKEKAKPRQDIGATAEIANELLEKLLATPPRKRKPR
jgi:predicted component of type VI protein secretion system